MALIEILQTKEIESSDTTSFLTNTIRSILFSTAPKGKESEIDKNLKKISLEEVADHDCADDCWMIIYDRVYELTRFLKEVSHLRVYVWIKLEDRSRASERLSTSRESQMFDRKKIL